MKTLSLATLGLLVAFSLSATVHAASDVEALRGQLSVLTRALTELRILHGDGSTVPSEYQPLSVSAMREILALGTRWLMHAQEESGHFRYEYVPYEDDYLRGDNIVRQAGTFFELGEIERLDEGDAYNLEDELIRSAHFFENLSRESTVDGDMFRCIVDHEEGRTCKLGATALALIGLIDMVEEYPQHKKEYAPLISDYATYIRKTKKDDAGFRYYYNVGSTFRRDDESSFSNGEALLALVRYYQHEEDEAVKEVINDTFAYLKKTPFDTALYLWAMAALKDMHVLWPNPEYISYAQAYTDWRIQDFTYRKRTPHNMCAYTEGVVSAYILLEDSLDQARKARYLNDIEYWLWKNAQLQLTHEDTERLIFEDGVPRIATLSDAPRGLGGFLTGHDVLTERIDFTQHCLSTYVQTLAEIKRVPLR